MIWRTTETDHRAGSGATNQWTYQFDAQKRLVDVARTGDAGALHYHYQYDAAGNRTQETVDGVGKVFTYNALGQQTAAGAVSYTYDAYGRLEYEKVRGNTTRHYYWNDLDRLCKVDLIDGGVTRSIAYSYDGRGNMVGRSDESGTNRYLVDERAPTGRSEIAAEVDATATGVKQRYGWGEELMTQRPDAGGAPQMPLTDGQGSIHGLTDNAGAVISGSELDYSPYGEPLGGSNGSLTQHAYLGQWRDGALNLQFHRARWLRASGASWLSPDPSFDWPHNFGNPYAYCGGDPINKRDPSGLFSLGELNVTGAMQSIMTQIVIPNTVEFMMRAVVTAIGVDNIMNVMEPVFEYVADKFGLFEFMEELASVMPEALDMLDDMGLLELASRVTKIITIIQLGLDTISAIQSVVQLFFNKSITNAYNAYQSMISLMHAYSALGQTISTELNPGHLETAWPDRYVPGETQLHHIATKYGKYGELFRAIYKSMGIVDENGEGNLDFAANIMSIEGHKGPHTVPLNSDGKPEYHEWVLAKITRSQAKIEKKAGSDMAKRSSMFEKSLVKLGNELLNNKRMIDILTKRL